MAGILLGFWRRGLAARKPTQATGKAFTFRVGFAGGLVGRGGGTAFRRTTT
jgi:hypothetical protein